MGLAGTGNDYKHQIIITYIIYALMDKFTTTKKYKNYLPFPEFSLKPERQEIPDITIRKITKGELAEPVVLIEICNSKMVKKDGEKLDNIMKNIPSLKECFVINKDDLTIYRMGRTKTNKPTVLKKSNKSDFFKIDFLKVLNMIKI